MISVCIPCYEMSGKGHLFLSKILETLASQTYKNFEVVISDHSIGHDIENLCKNYSNLDINYIHNDENRGSSSHNINNAIRHSKYEIIKPLFQDDLIISKQHLEHISNSHANWGFCNFTHTNEIESEQTRPMTPSLNPNLATGTNTIGCPSVIFFRKDSELLFDDNLIWLMDCEFYYRLMQKYGSPYHINNYDICVRIWGDSVSQKVSEETKRSEESYVRGKHNV